MVVVGVGLIVVVAEVVVLIVVVVRKVAVMNGGIGDSTNSSALEAIGGGLMSVIVTPLTSSSIKCRSIRCSC